MSKSLVTAMSLAAGTLYNVPARTDQIALTSGVSAGFEARVGKSRDCSGSAGLGSSPKARWRSMIGSTPADALSAIRASRCSVSR